MNIKHIENGYLQVPRQSRRCVMDYVNKVTNLIKLNFLNIFLTEPMWFKLLIVSLNLMSRDLRVVIYD